MSFAGSKVVEKIVEAGLHPPKMLTLMITSTCNLQCRHCWLDCRPDNAAQAVKTETVHRVLREFGELGGQTVCLTGGEALIHPAWKDILSFACSHCEFQQVRFQTNATLLTAGDVAFLASLDHPELTIQVSLDGATAATHDHVRGAGSFERSMRGLSRLGEAGLGARILVAFTEMTHNLKELPELFERLDAMGVGRIVSGTLVLGGRAGKAVELAMPRPEQYEELLQRYHQDPQFKALYRKLGTISALEWYHGRSDGAAHRCSCIENPFITADGKMYPCVMLLCDDFAASGTHDCSLADVVREMLPRWAELPRIHRLRTERLLGCNGCVGRKHCAGGCMGRAYAGHGDLMTVEDRCALRKAVYSWQPP